jgi:parallel beta-helix repeat protein
VYRERVVPARGGEEGKPITYTAAPGEQVYIKGSEAFTPAWQEVEGHPGVYRGLFDPAIFAAENYNPYKCTARCLSDKQTLGAVFADGQPLNEMEEMEQVYATPGSWKALPEGKGVCVNFGAGVKPSDRFVEVSARRRIFAPKKRGLGYITIRGFIFEHAANESAGGFFTAGGPPQAGAVGTRSGNHWIIENNVIRFAESTGLDCGIEKEFGPTNACEHCGWIDGDTLPIPEVVGYHIIRNNIISDNGECGMNGLGHIGTQVIGNIVERNNRLHYDRSIWENAGIKFHYFVNGLIADNLIRDNEAWGIWLDNVWPGSRITRNVIVNNRHAGIFLELAGGPLLVDNNVIANSRPGTEGGDLHKGSGIYSHDVAGPVICHNLIFGNAHYAVDMQKDGPRPWAVLPPDTKDWSRVLRWHERWVAGEVEQEEEVIEDRGQSNWRIYNNIIFDNKDGVFGIPFPSEYCRDNLTDDNVLGKDPQFCAKTAHQSSLSEIMAALDKMLDAQGAPQAGRPQPRGTGRRAEAPMLSLAQWRGLMGNDKDSVVARAIAASIEGREKVTLTLEEDLGGAKIATQPIAGVDKDFFGNPMPQTNPLPGPFQNLKPGPNEFVVWPMAQ